MEIIDREIRLCGYFVLVTSEKMTADALATYKSRDGSEKLFSGDKFHICVHAPDRHKRS